jgi:hypothetical protein
MFNKKPEIKFVNLQPELINKPSLEPRPYKEFLPEWWRQIPTKHDNILTIRRCPGITDFFSNMYVVPMWTDLKIYFNKEGNGLDINFKTTDTFPMWERHDSRQLLDHMNISIGDREVETVLKIISPWNIITPKGYSVLQIPLFYHFEQDYTILPGIFDTDIYHEINVPFLLHSNNKKIEFHEGQPLLAFIPFKRTKYSQKNINANDTKYINYLIEQANKFIDYRFGDKPNAYRRMQKERDSGTIDKNTRFEETL